MMNLEEHHHLNTASSIFSERYAPFFQNGIKPHKIIRFENVAVQ
jgi:hypothetical protein